MSETTTLDRSPITPEQHDALLTDAMARREAGVGAEERLAFQDMREINDRPVVAAAETPEQADEPVLNEHVRFIQDVGKIGTKFVELIKGPEEPKAATPEVNPNANLDQAAVNKSINDYDRLADLAQGNEHSVVPDKSSQLYDRMAAQLNAGQPPVEAPKL